MVAGGAGALGAGTDLGPYRLGEMLGTGGMGTVYAATLERKAAGLDAGTRVAVKIVHPHLLETEGFFKRFLREGEIGQSVDHENVVRTFDCPQLVLSGRPNAFLVMEYVEGQTLRDLLVELDRVPEELCRHVGREIAKGLAAIHDAGVVHRDLKPENVLITEEHVVKVMDLGVARLQDEAVRLSQTGAFVGSIHYAAPEQFGEGSGIDHRADLHALGLLLYELACGQHPYYDDDFRGVLKRLLHEEPRRVAEINPQLSPFLEEVIHKLIAKERDERFGTAAEVAEILDAGESCEWWQEHAKALRIKTKQPLRRIRIVRETALYGRDAALAKLRALFGDVKGCSGKVLLVEGEAGIGKTRLVDEFVGRLRQGGEDLNFLFGSYPPGGAATAAGAFSTAYREHFGEIGLAETLRAHLTTTPLLIPAFAALLTGDATPKDEEPLTKDSLQTMFVHATRSLAAERPTVVLIDDLHFAPDDGRALFAALATAVAEYRILLVGTARPGVPKDWVANVERLEHAMRLPLHRLGPKDLIRLLEDSLRSKRLAEQLGAQIAVKSDGNPFFAFEIIQGLREGQFITQSEDGSWVSTRVIDEIQIPSSVMDLIHARIADLTEEERDLLDVASCCGFEFDPLLVAAALGMSQIPAMKRLARIEKTHRLVRSAGRRCVFDHHQVQEALYDGLPELLREPYHAALAEALETRERAAEKDPEDLDGALCVELCRHYLAAARGESALRYVTAALDHLVAGYQNAQALALADRALAVPDLATGVERAELLLRKAGRLEPLGRHDAERAALDEAQTLAEQDGGLRLRARVARSVGWHLWRIARYEEAHAVLTRAIELAQAAGDKSIEAGATGNRGIVFYSQGRYEEARLHHERHLALAREIGDRRGEIRATGNLGSVFWSRGRHEEALLHYERNLGLAREIGDRPAEAIVTGNLGNVCTSQGRYEEARLHFERCLALAREIGDRQGEAIARHNLGGHESQRLGDPTRAREHLEAARALAREIGFRLLDAHGALTLACNAEVGGETGAALAGYEEAVALARGLGVRGLLAEALTVFGALLANDGRADEARTHLEEALELALDTGTPGVSVLAPCHLALLPGGDADAARKAFEEFEPRLEFPDRLKARFLLWTATSDTAHRAEAHRLLVELLTNNPEERHEAMLTNVPLHRDIAAAWEAQGG